MSNNQEPELITLEDWFDELADESLDPLNILINEEETEETDMSTLTMKKSTPDFDLNAWLKAAAVVTNQPVRDTAAIIPSPEWLTLKSGLVTRDNAFVVTAGVIKAARQVLDAISYTKLQHEAAVEALTMQEQRATHTTRFSKSTGEITETPRDTYNRIDQDDMTVAMQLNGEEDTSHDRVFRKGFNPDGNEYDEAIQALAAEVDKLEVVLDNGKRIMADIITWIGKHAEDLGLRVATGYTTRVGIIGNEIRTPRYELLTPETLMYGIAEQREFIRNNRA